MCLSQDRLLLLLRMADISSPPAHNGVQDNGRIREGLAEVLPIEGNKVFYNNVQVV